MKIELVFLASSALAAAYFGQGTGPVAFRHVRCSGSEERLLDCGAVTIPTYYYCRHNEDAGVRCYIQTGICKVSCRMVKTLNNLTP